MGVQTTVGLCRCMVVHRGSREADFILPFPSPFCEGVKRYVPSVASGRGTHVTDGVLPPRASSISDGSLAQPMQARLSATFNAWGATPVGGRGRIRF